ncbi:glycosyltransferase family 4 protein [Hathewaya histolytica]|uniref:glycosyltransferase family 4 protein n=1 Tax=Hathewaya histolytica TaxID=1498 RepID=UPI003B681C14
MKILITTDTYFPMVNGVVISTNNLYRELKKLGHDVRILTLSDSHKSRIEGDVYYIRSAGLRIYPGARIGNPFFNSITQEILDWKPDIIHSQTEFTTMVLSKIISKKLNVPQVHTYHTMYEDYLHYVLGGKFLGKSTAAKLTSMLLNPLDGVITPTKKVEETLKTYGISTNTFIIPTGIDIEKFKTKISEEEINVLFEKHKIPKSGKRLIYVGRIAEEKNIEEVIEFYNDICRNRDISLVIVGGGPYLQKLKDLVKSLNIEDRVYFTDMVDTEEVHKYYKLGDAFVTASTSETQGLTYVEALASGLPVLCKYDECVEHLIINDYNGYTYNNKEEFIEAIDKIFYKQGNLEEFHKNSLKKSKEYSSEIFGLKVQDVYEEVLKKNSMVKLVV